MHASLDTHVQTNAVARSQKGPATEHSRCTLWGTGKEQHVPQQRPLPAKSPGENHGLCNCTYSQCPEQAHLRSTESIRGLQRVTAGANGAHQLTSHLSGVMERS